MNESNGVIVDNIEFDTLEDVYKAIKDGTLKVELRVAPDNVADNVLECDKDTQYEAFVEHLNSKDRDDYEMEKASLLNKHNKQMDDLYYKYTELASKNERIFYMDNMKKKILYRLSLSEIDYRSILKDLYHHGFIDKEVSHLFESEFHGDIKY